MTSLEVPAALADLNVFILDDAKTNCDLLVGALERVGCRSVVAETDPRRAVAAFKDQLPDLLLLDWHMPRVDGPRVLSVVQERVGVDDFVPVVVLTADTTAPTRDAALSAGATDFLTKPFDLAEVVLRVRNLLQARAMHLRLVAHNAELEQEVQSFTEADRRADLERAAKADRIEALIADRSLTMVFQPIVELETRSIVGIEALARFPSPPQRPPNEWFAEAESVGMGTELELAAVSLALRRIGELPDGAYLSVNASPATARTPAFERLVTGTSPDRIVVELTEHARVDDYGTLTRALGRLRTSGVRIAVDDAGAGYSGLQHILRLEPHIIKLDRNLIQDIDSDKGRRAMAASQVAFAREVGAVLIAEGVETEAECETLRSLGVLCGQGYLFMRPGPLPLPSSPLPGAPL